MTAAEWDTLYIEELRDMLKIDPEFDDDIPTMPIPRKLKKEIIAIDSEGRCLTKALEIEDITSLVRYHYDSWQLELSKFWRSVADMLE